VPVAPVVCFPESSSGNIFEDIFRIGEDLHASYLGPWLIATNPLKSGDASEKLHSIVITFRASKFEDLFFVAVHFVWIYDYGRTSGFPSRIFEARAIGIYVNRAWIICHDAICFRCDS
jgi:hypothetical protein